MLSTIREKTQGWIAFLLLAVITVPFALWGISSYFGGSSGSYVARVNGTPITAAEYQQALQQTEQGDEQMLGRKLDPGLFDTPQFRTAALEPLIDRTLLAQHLSRQGFRVSDQELGAVIRHMSAFRVNHHFDLNHYRAVLAQNGYTVSGFEATMRTSVLLRQLQGGLVDSGFVPHEQLNAVLALQGERRQIEYQNFNPASYSATVQLTPAVIAAYYQAHQVEYTVPEQLQLAYIKLSPAALARHIKIPDATLRSAYQAQAQQFRVPSERRVSHILILVPKSAPAQVQAQALAKAQMIEARLKAGIPFASLAKQYSDDAGSASVGGDLGFVRSGTMPSAFDAAVKRLAVGQISAPVRTRYGYHIIELTALKPGGVKPFNTVRGELERMARSQYANKKIGGLADRLRRLVYQHPDGLAPAAQALGLPVKQSVWFSRGGVGQGVAADPLVLKAAMSDAVLSQGRNSSVLRLAGHTFISVRIAATRPAVVTPLKQVQAQIVAQLTVQAEARAARQAARQFLAQVQRQGPQSIQHWVGPDWVTRDTSGVDAHLIKAVFRAPKPVGGQAVSAMTPLAVGGYAVFVVQSVMPGDPAQVGVAARGELRSALQAADKTGLYQDYVAGLRKRAKIKIYQKNL